MDEEVQSSPPFPVGVQKNVTDDGGVRKLVRVEGQGWRTPQEGDRVTVHYVGTLTGTGELFDSSRERGEPFSFTAGVGEVIAGWDKGVLTMRKGERAVITCSADNAYGDGGAPPKIPPGASLDFDIELLAWENSRDISPGRDETLVKHVVKPGEGFDRPQARDEVVMTVTASLEDGTVVLDGADATFTVREGYWCPAVATTASTMLLGEECRVEAAACHCFGDAGLPGKVPGGQRLVLDMALREVHPVDDLPVRGLELSRKIVRIGEGFDRPDDEATVTMRYRMWCVSRERGYRHAVEDRHWDEAEARTFVIDEDAVAPALDELAKRMKKRELAVLLVPREQAAGLVGVTMPDEVKDAADAAVEVEAEMLEFVKDRMTWQLADAERLPFAEAKKNSGNHWFKAGDLDRALKRYQKGCEALDFEQDAPPEAADLKASCMLNQAAVHLKRRSFHDVIRCCKEVLHHSPASIKALFRKAQAHAHLGDLDQAVLDLQSALQSQPDEATARSIQAELRRVQHELRESSRKQDFFARMFQA